MIALLMAVAMFQIDAHAGMTADTAAAMPAQGDEQFSYDGANSSTRRRSPAVQLVSGDDELPADKRRRLVSNARDIQRNFGIASWAIRKHLDFVTNFAFASNNAENVIGPVTADADLTPEQLADEATKSQLDDDVEGIIREASAAANCDAAGRHDLATMLRLAEARATVDGDVFLLDLADGSLQAIEADRVRDPGDRGKNRWVQGVQIDPRGRAIGYAVHSRNGTRYTFERTIAAANVAQRAYFDRFDQVRGISPMAPALNTLRDVYEGFDYALARAKIEQLFGLKITRGGEDAIGNITETDNASGHKDYKVDFGKGLFALDMEQGDDAEFLETKAPGQNFISYSELMIAVSLLSLDLPWNFFKVDATNFFGSRAALNLYLQSVKPKRRANLAILQRWTRRQLQLAILRGRLRLPAGQTVDDLRWSWTPDGLPWWNPNQEADGALKSINAGIDNPQRIALETGTNFFSNVDRIAECLRYARRRNVPLSFAIQSPITIQGGTADA